MGRMFAAALAGLGSMFFATIALGGVRAIGSVQYGRATIPADLHTAVSKVAGFLFLKNAISALHGCLESGQRQNTPATWHCEILRFLMVLGIRRAVAFTLLSDCVCETINEIAAAFQPLRVFVVFRCGNARAHA